MKSYKEVICASLGIATLGFAGCDLVLNGRPREDRVYVQSRTQYIQQPQPVYVEPQPQYILIQQAPPPVIVERRPAPPSAAHIWIDGSWNWDRQRYSWVAGRYEVPPQPDVIWVTAQYQPDAKGVRYIPGQWTKRDQGNSYGKGNGYGNGNGNGRGRGRGN
jgi:hypothetical protein